MFQQMLGQRTHAWVIFGWFLVLEVWKQEIMARLRIMQINSMPGLGLSSWKWCGICCRRRTFNVENVFVLVRTCRAVISCFVPYPLDTCKEESLSAEWEEEASAGAGGVNLSHGWGRNHEAEQIPPEGRWDASCWRTIRNQRATTNEVVFEALGNHSLYLFSLFEHWSNKCTHVGYVCTPPNMQHCVMVHRWGKGGSVETSGSGHQHLMLHSHGAAVVKFPYVLCSSWSFTCGDTILWPSTKCRYPCPLMMICAFFGPAFSC